MQYGPHYVIIMCGHLTSDSTASTFNRSSQYHQQHRHLASYLQWKLSAWWWCEYAILSAAMELEDLNEEIMASKKFLKWNIWRCIPPPPHLPIARGGALRIPCGCSFPGAAGVMPAPRPGTECVYNPPPPSTLN